MSNFWRVKWKSSLNTTNQKAKGMAGSNQDLAKTPAGGKKNPVVINSFSSQQGKKKKHNILQQMEVEKQALPEDPCRGGSKDPVSMGPTKKKKVPMIILGDGNVDQPPCRGRIRVECWCLLL